jgi:hypothetical protein
MEFALPDVRGEVPVTTLVKSGNTLREIENLARTGAVDLLVISTHARAGLPDFCLKSGAEELVRYAPCPVLVVREQERDFFCEGLQAHGPRTGRPHRSARDWSALKQLADWGHRQRQSEYLLPWAGLLRCGCHCAAQPRNRLPMPQSRSWLRPRGSAAEREPGTSRICAPLREGHSYVPSRPGSAPAL